MKLREAAALVRAVLAMGIFIVLLVAIVPVALVLDVVDLITESLAKRRVRHEERRRSEDPRIERSLAERRACMLLERCLSPRQREQMRRFDCFTVKTDRGEFAILPSLTYNVYAVEDCERYCCAAAQPLPIADHMLMQKLLLEADTDRFFRIANRSPFGSSEGKRKFHEALLKVAAC